MIETRRIAAGPVPGAAGPIDAELEARIAEHQKPCGPSARAGRRTTRDKLVAGLIGWKLAIRGDSSFFAHGYRAVLIGLAAGTLGVGVVEWVFLILCFGLVLIAELFHSAIDTLARAQGDPDEPLPLMARQIAAGGVLAAVVIYAAVSVAILVLKLGDLFGWWR